MFKAAGSRMGRSSIVRIPGADGGSLTTSVAKLSIVRVIEDWLRTVAVWHDWA
jgi:hypothetical protein